MLGPIDDDVDDKDPRPDEDEPVEDPWEEGDPADRRRDPLRKP